ncbi:unnamed protein product [Acanthoscelides obtectus]|uniref:Uncharacterized protein n=1 Tax=Acanthoscelides obtectus TaxID=200917 RepID=A0A9P0LJP2_ACAOB|nr:unnamed protein product [Acanthoscelides obtectus]CAK1663498.1 hypothetical protein AOBTE_LOCUS23710 [Acanthoscelides obtectus]
MKAEYDAVINDGVTLTLKLTSFWKEVRKLDFYWKITGSIWQKRKMSFESARKATRKMNRHSVILHGKKRTRRTYLQRRAEDLTVLIYDCVDFVAKGKVPNGHILY